MPADRAPGTVCSLACDYPSNCMGKPDNSHTQFAAKAAAPKTQRCAVANAKRARDWESGTVSCHEHRNGFGLVPQERFRDTVIPSLSFNVVAAPPPPPPPGVILILAVK
jgi:hypothetical protein